MSIQWEKIRQSASPTPQFKEELRAVLYENSALEDQKQFEKIVQKVALPSSVLELSFQAHSSPFSSVEKFAENFSLFFHSFRRWVFLVGGGALAMIMVVPMISIFLSAPLSASTKSYIHTFSGEGTITRVNEAFIPQSDQEIFVEDRIRTNARSAAEILFFEGTSLRLDVNTEIKILDLSPESGVFSQGGVQVELIEGRVWVQNFHSPSTQSALEIVTQNTEIFPIRANIDIEYRGGKEHIRVFENSALVHVEGIALESEVLLDAEQELVFTPFDTQVVPGDISMQSSLWKIRNKNRSLQYKRAYLQNISDKMKEEFVIDEITSQIHTFIEQDPSPREMEKMIEKMNLIMNISEDTQLSHNTTDLLEENIQNLENANLVAVQDTEITPDIIVPAEKTLIPQKNQPKAQYQAIKKTVPAQEKTSDSVASLSLITPLSLERVREPQAGVESEILSETTQEELVELDEFEEAEKSKLVKTAKDVIQEKQKEKFKKASLSFSEQVNTLSLRDSRRNHAKNILNTIPDTPENIELLDIMSETAPTDVQRYIQAKKIKILRASSENNE